MAGMERQSLSSLWISTGRLIRQQWKQRITMKNGWQTESRECRRTSGKMRSSFMYLYYARFSHHPTISLLVSCRFRIYRSHLFSSRIHSTTASWSTINAARSILTIDSPWRVVPWLNAGYTWPALNRDASKLTVIQGRLKLWVLCTVSIIAFCDGNCIWL